VARTVDHQRAPDLFRRVLNQTASVTVHVDCRIGLQNLHWRHGRDRFGGLCRACGEPQKRTGGQKAPPCRETWFASRCVGPGHIVWLIRVDRLDIRQARTSQHEAPAALVSSSNAEVTLESHQSLGHGHRLDHCNVDAGFALARNTAEATSRIGCQKKISMLERKLGNRYIAFDGDRSKGANVVA
jgi:hypothetical protein